MLEAMASCHSITRIHGDLAGDPLDCKMFEFTKWELIEPNPEETENYDSLAPTIVRPRQNNNAQSAVKSEFSAEISESNDIGIIKQFPFSSSLQRMSVVVRALSRTNFTLYCKGSPEKIAEMCKPETLPKNFQAVLTMFTREGYRVIGVATRSVDFSLVKIRRLER
jgi:magnesium-transporting ATPase (P-type)